MSLKSQETVAANQQKITFDVDRAAFDAAINKVFKSSSKNITIPGFRKGKAPRALVEKMYGKEVFYEDAINEIIPDAYAEVIKEVKETVVSRPEFDVVSIDENGVVLSATFFTKPDVEIKDYFGIAATRPVSHATDADVDAEIEKVRARNSRMIEITDRAAAIDDVVTIDFDGYVDGAQFDGGKADGHQLKLGSGQFIPGFEEQVVGHVIGDSFDVNVTFPADYHAENLAGKEAVFKCNLNGIKFNELPALDDEFARDVSEFDTLDEYKADIKNHIEEDKKKHSDLHVDDDLVKALIEKLEGEIPECMFENETENFVRDYDNKLRMNGLDLQTYFKYTGLDLDALRKQMRPDAERQVKTRIALEKIAALENIEVSDDEVEAEFKRIADEYKLEVEKIKESVEKDAIIEDLKVKKAIELVREKAVITDVEEDEHHHDAE